MNVTINGCARQVVASEDLVLLDLLRENFRLTGTKQSCDRKGQCGACMVVVNGKAVLSCITKVENLEEPISFRLKDWGPLDLGSVRPGRRHPVRVLYTRNDYGHQSPAGCQSRPER